MKSFIGNKATEKDIREWLDTEGFFGGTAQFQELELHAIQRPGFLQVFRFVAEAKTKFGDWHTVYGAVRDDERYSNGLTIKRFASEDEQMSQLQEWSHGLFQPRSRRSQEEASQQNTWGIRMVLALMLFVTLGVSIFLALKLVTGP